MTGYDTITYSARDGLMLYARDYRSSGTGTPVICLPGLTRNSADFEDLAPSLAAYRRVLCPDLRGRGQSAYAPDPTSYSPVQEWEDVTHLMAVAGIHRAVLIGTSRGGLISILAAVARPTAVAGIVLNDIGPEIARAGLERIASYVGQTQPVTTWDQAAAQVKAINAAQFPLFDDAAWMRMARRTYVEVAGQPKLAYDPQIGTATRAAMPPPDQPPANLWVPFQALAAIPTAAIRGALSDILSADTLAKMLAAKPDLITATIPNVGHAPMLDEPEALAAIDALLARVDVG